MNMILYYTQTGWHTVKGMHGFKGIRCTFAVDIYFSISLLQRPLLLHVLIVVVGTVLAFSQRYGFKVE